MADPEAGSMAEDDTVTPGIDERDFMSVVIKNWEAYQKNETYHIDPSRPFIVTSLIYVYPLFVFLHACVSVVGIGGNFSILVVIIKGRLYKNPTFLFIGNLAMSDLIKVLVAPFTLANLLIQNFIFGSFMCIFLPMVHCFPIHASMLTYTLIAADRYRFIVHPMKSRVPAGLFTIAVWVISVCVVLPYAVYIKYIDLNPMKADTGLCRVDHDRHIEEYIRAMFVIFYCLPIVVVIFFYVKVSVDMKCRDSNCVSLHIADTSQSVSEATYQTHITWASGESEPRPDCDGNSVSSIPRTHVQLHRRHSYEEDDIDMCKEKRTQKYMIAMVTLFAMCWCPITILILVTHFVVEDEENSVRFDITYLTFTFFGYMSTCINPILFASWRMSDRTKNRLRGYFQFSNRRRASANSGLGRVAENDSRASKSPAPKSPSVSTNGQDSVKPSRTFV